LALLDQARLDNHSVILENIRMKNTAATRIFAALSHEARLDLLKNLVVAGCDGLNVGELSTLTGRNIKTISAQLKILAEAGVLSSKRFGKNIVYRAEFETLAEVIAYIVDDCCCGHPSLRRSVAKGCSP
jgi:DNA-binding transcriptional ArsR family regulator